MSTQKPFEGNFRGFLRFGLAFGNQTLELKSKSKNTAVENRKLQGKVKMTFLNGEVVYSN